MESNELVQKIVKALDDKKANDIVIIKIDEQTIVADYFVIATATSNTHLRALSDEVEFQLEQSGVKADHTEGRATGWVLLQYSGIVVHLFLEDARQYYNLERLWADGTKLSVSDFLK